jgi:hypothetical protein
VTIDDLVARHPHLYHMAEDGSWPSIAARGLLSTSRLLDLFEVYGDERAVIEGSWRREKVSLRNEGLGQVTIRDQKPLPPARLATCLEDGITPEEWYRRLNSRVFFWLTEARLERLLQARGYRKDAQTVLIVRTEPLVRRYEGAIELSPINSGAVFPIARPRGERTFQTIHGFQAAGGPAELSVIGGVPDISDFVTRVERRAPGGSRELLFER